MALSCYRSRPQSFLVKCELSHKCRKSPAPAGLFFTSAAAKNFCAFTHFPLASCNENLPEKRIHRNCARRPGGMPRRVFCCAHASRTRACRHRDADRRLQKRGGHCFATVLYNENTYHNVWRRRAVTV